MIEAREITARLGDQDILHAVSLAVEPGVFTIVLGPNGAGKSTLLRCLAGDLPPTRGGILLDGRPLSTISKAELATRRAVLPQKSHLAFPFTVHEVVGLGLHPHGRIPSAQGRGLVGASLERVGLTDYAHRLYQQLSGGEQQRVQIARVLCQLEAGGERGNARYLLLDEPISSLDLRHQLATLDLALAFARAGGGAFAILHDLNLASLYADRLVVMSEGRIAADGAPQDVLTTEVVQSVFEVGMVLNRLPSNGRPFALPHTAR